MKFKKASKQKTGTSSFSGAKSADELDRPVDEDLVVANGRILQLEKELAQCKAELQAMKESSAASNNETLNLLKSENADLKQLINELQGECADMKKVFGSLDDLGDLRNQYERLFEEDFKSPNNNENVVSSNIINPAASEERREKTRVFCDELKSFILDTRANSLGRRQ